MGTYGNMKDPPKKLKKRRVPCLSLGVMKKVLPGIQRIENDQ